jgi:hypothetical protein
MARAAYSIGAGRGSLKFQEASTLTFQQVRWGTWRLQSFLPCTTARQRELCYLITALL